MRNYSVADYTFAALPFEKVLRLAELLKMRFLDIGFTQSDGFHFRIERVSKHAGKELKQAAREHGLRISDVFMMLGERGNDPRESVRRRVLEYWKRGAEFALESGCGHITLLPGLQYDADAFARACDTLNAFSEFAHDVGLIFAVEPHTTSVIDTPQKALRMLAEVRDLTLTLDYSHFVRDGIPQESVHALIPYASHLHCRHAAAGRLQTREDESEIDYAAVTDALKRAQYDKGICLEFCVDAWERQNEVDAISEIWKMRALLERYFWEK